MKRRRGHSTDRRHRRILTATERATPSRQDSSAPSFSQQLLHYEAANGWPTPDIAALILMPLYLVPRLAGILMRPLTAAASRLIQRR
ncbi:MAG: hypothetical protein M3395_02965 [Chloroflexota bacterium]|nr:hypothetical protein [Chloroflexota bacterium]